MLLEKYVRKSSDKKALKKINSADIYKIPIGFSDFIFKTKSKIKSIREKHFQSIDKPIFEGRKESLIKAF